MKSKMGELIELNWDGYPEFYYVRGHVPDEAAEEVVLDFDDSLTPTFCKHIYAKWVRVGPSHQLYQWDLDGRIQTYLITRKDKCPGWFPVTEVSV